MSAETPAALLAEAHRLDAEAITAGEEGPRGRTLRAEAAALRLRAIGEREYPVLVCGSCFRLTGWTTAAGSCDLCARRAARHAAEAASRGWLPAPDAAYPQPLAVPQVPLGVRLAARVGRRRGLDQAVAHAWMEHVEPGDTGPVEPEPGYEVECATRDEIERVDGSGILVRFATSTHRFGAAAWARLPTTRIGRSALPNPAEFGAELPIETLVEAWSDYQQAVAAINRATWAARGEEREARRLGAAAHEQVLREQQRTSELLHE